MTTNFPNYDAIEAVSGINIESQALQKQAVEFFLIPENQVSETQKFSRNEQAEVIQVLAEKLKANAEKILEALKK